MQYISEGILDSLIDRFMPNNCRKQLHVASLDNKAACDKAVELIQSHKENIVHKISTPSNR